MENDHSSVTMCATVLQVCPCELCVCDHETCQKVLVHTDNACCFRVGQQVCIEYCGAMTPDHRRLRPAGKLLLLNENDRPEQ